MHANIHLHGASPRPVIPMNLRSLFITTLCLTAALPLPACDRTSEEESEPPAPPIVTSAPVRHKHELLRSLDEMASSGECSPVERADVVLRKMRDGLAAPEVEAQLATMTGWRTAEIQVFLVLMAHYAERCVQDSASSAALYAHIDATALAEETVEAAVGQRACGFVRVLVTHNLWPFGRTFAREIEDAKYEEAEVTRVLWTTTLAKIRANCSPHFNAREQAIVATKLDTLRRIVGLTDPTLIELRTLKIRALKANDEARILRYTQAINDREQVVAATSPRSEPESTSPAEAAPTLPAEAALPAEERTSQTIARTAADVAATANSVHKTANKVRETVETTRKVLSVFGL